MKKNLKSFLVALLFVLCFGMTAHAAPKLSQKKASLVIGQKITLKVKNRGKRNVKWSSSNKKVASVSSKGKVKAKKKGTAVITARVGNRKLKCRVTVVKKAKRTSPAAMEIESPHASSGDSGSASSSSSSSSSSYALCPVPPDELAVYNTIMSLKSRYPDGMEWTNNIHYDWKGGIYRGGYGCAAFAFILSDAAFGEAPARLHTDVSRIRIGDVLRMYSNTHVAVVIGRYTDGGFAIAEGNNGKKVKWGRRISPQELSDISLVITRWPV